MWVGGVGRWVVSYVSCVIFLQRERERKRERERGREREIKRNRQRDGESVYSGEIGGKARCVEDSSAGNTGLSLMPSQVTGKGIQR